MGRVLGAFLLIATAATITAAQPSAPVPAPESVPPAYPDAASVAGIEGPVRYRAYVSAAGNVTSVDILDVPATGYGLEDAVRRTVSTWRFTPAMKDGQRVDGVYESAAEMAPVLPGEFAVDAPPGDLWRAMLELVKAQGLAIDKIDRASQVLRTRRARYNSSVFPNAERLGLPAGTTIDNTQWYLAVAPGFRPARVGIGVVTTLTRASDRQSFTLYNSPELVHWWRARLTEPLRASSEPLFAGPTRRARQSPRIPGSEPDVCSATPRPPVPMRQLQAGQTRPQLVSQSELIYPGRLLKQQIQGTVALQGIVTEHGSLASLQFLTPDMPEDFLMAAGASASLWRFVPARVDGCAVMTQVTVEMSFNVR